MTSRTDQVLFLCTGNSARSILAEAILNLRGGGRLRAHSAGSAPTGRVHPTALALLAERGIPTGELRSKSWEEFARPGAPPIDVVITVCDAAAGETCPVWPGRPVTAHWGLPDPAACTGPPAEQRRLFEETWRQLETRIEGFLALDRRPEARGALAEALARIGRDET